MGDRSADASSIGKHPRRSGFLYFRPVDFIQPCSWTCLKERYPELLNGSYGAALLAAGVADKMDRRSPVAQACRMGEARELD